LRRWNIPLASRLRCVHHAHHAITTKAGNALATVQAEVDNKAVIVSVADVPNKVVPAVVHLTNSALHIKGRVKAATLVMAAADAAILTSSKVKAVAAIIALITALHRVKGKDKAGKISNRKPMPICPWIANSAKGLTVVSTVAHNANVKAGLTRVLATLRHAVIKVALTKLGVGKNLTTRNRAKNPKQINKSLSVTRKNAVSSRSKHYHAARHGRTAPQTRGINPRTSGTG
jgi:hypothetical protein